MIEEHVWLAYRVGGSRHGSKVTMAFCGRVAIWLSSGCPPSNPSRSFSIHPAHKAAGGGCGDGYGTVEISCSVPSSTSRPVPYLGYVPVSACVQGLSAGCGRSPAHHVAAPAVAWVRSITLWRWWWGSTLIRPTGRCVYTLQLPWVIT
jgi:hypothetical protein